MTGPRIIRIQPADNVAVAVEDIEADAPVTLDGITLLARQVIPRGHKIALADIPTGDNVIKYGYPIGRATAAIAPGEHVHTHNVTTNLDGLLEYSYKPRETPE